MDSQLHYYFSKCTQSWCLKVIFCLFPFFYLPVSSQSSDIAMVSFLSASLSLGSLCHLGYHLKTRSLKRNRHFLSSFPTFVLPFPSYPAYCFQTYLKALISSCRSLNKNCSVFTLHPISGCSIAPTLSSVFFFYSFPTHSLPSNWTSCLILFTYTHDFFLCCYPYLECCLFSLPLPFSIQFLSILQDSPQILSFWSWTILPYSPFMFVSPIHLIEQHLRWC